MNSDLYLEDKVKLSEESDKYESHPNEVKEAVGEVVTVSSRFVYVKWETGHVGAYRLHLNDLIKQEEKGK